MQRSGGEQAHSPHRRGRPPSREARTTLPRNWRALGRFWPFLAVFAHFGPVSRERPPAWRGAQIAQGPLAALTRSPELCRTSLVTTRAGRHASTIETAGAPGPLRVGVVHVVGTGAFLGQNDENWVPVLGGRICTGPFRWVAVVACGAVWCNGPEGSRRAQWRRFRALSALGARPITPATLYRRCGVCPVPQKSGRVGVRNHNPGKNAQVSRAAEPHRYGATWLRSGTMFGPRQKSHRAGVRISACDLCLLDDPVELHRQHAPRLRDPNSRPWSPPKKRS